MDTWTHRSMEMDAILHSSNLAPKTSFPQLPSFQNTAHVFPSTIHPQNLQIVLCRECVRERDKKHSAREKERGEREAQFNPVHSLSTASSGPVRNQQQESGIKRLCTERHSRNGPSYSPQRLSESHTPAPALSFFFHWLSLRILSNNSHSGERGGVYLACHCVPRISALPMAGSECLRSDITPGPS